MPIVIPYRSIMRVYFDDLDALNILHNVRYMLFMERARGELFNSLGFRWEDDLTVNPDKAHVIAEHTIRYLVPVRGECDLAVEVTPTHLGRSSMIIDKRILSLSGDVVHAEGSTRLVRLEATPIEGSQKPRTCPWSDRFRSTFAPLVRPRPTPPADHH